MDIKKEVTSPILSALEDIIVAVEEKEGVEAVTVTNIKEAQADLSEVVSALRALLEKEVAPIVVNPAKNDVTLDLAPVLGVLTQIEKRIPTYTPPEIKDYTELLSEIVTLLSKPEEKVNLSKIESGLSLLAKTDDIASLAAWLEAIYNKTNPEQPPFQFDSKGRLLVAVDRAGGGGGGLTTSESSALQGVATAAKQDTGNTSLNSIDGKTPPLGQALAASSVPVVLTAAQVSTLTPLPDNHNVTVSNLSTTNLSIKAADSPSIDAFSRWRVSNPSYVFDSTFQYDLQPLLYEAITSGSGATVTHDSTNRNALMTFSSTATGGKAYMQTYEWFRYQAGRSQLILLTFNFIETMADTLKFIGYGDGNNGIELQLNGSQPRIAFYSDTAKGDEFVNKNDWNLDKMDGNGVSGVNLNFTKTQIFVIDFQWLGVGRIRCGFDVDGIIYYCHEFTHANIQDVAYMQTANLPLRAGMTCTGTVSTTMRFICASVMSEGGQEDVGGYGFTAEGTATAGNGTRTHILSLRPNTTFNSITNRTKFVLDDIVLVATGASPNPVYWELCIGQAITQSPSIVYIDVNATYSGMEYNTLGTVSGNPAIVIASGYISGSTQARVPTSIKANMRYPITLDAAGAVRANGTLTLLVTGLGGTQATRAIMNWREIR